MNYYPIFGKNYRAFGVVVLFIYAIDKIFTQPPVAAVAPNINSGSMTQLWYKTIYDLYKKPKLTSNKFCLAWWMEPPLDTVENSIGGTNPAQGLISPKTLNLVWQKQHPQPYPYLLWLSPLTNRWSLGCRVDLQVVTKVSLLLLSLPFSSLSCQNHQRWCWENNDVSIPHPPNHHTGCFKNSVPAMVWSLVVSTLSFDAKN